MSRFSTRSESFSSESTNEREMASDPRPVIRPSSNRWTPSDTYGMLILLPTSSWSHTCNGVAAYSPQKTHSPQVAQPRLGTAESA